MAINEKFNPILGSRSDTSGRYYIPKWEIVKFILQGKEKRDIREIYGRKYARNSVVSKTLDIRLIKYFGTNIFYDIRLKLVKPLLDNCFKRGLTRAQTLVYLRESGVRIYETVGIEAFNYHLKDIYSKEGINFEGTINIYETIREVLFIKPYTDYLRSLGVGSQLDQTATRLQDIADGIDEWSITEHLFVSDYPLTSIALELGLVSESDKSKGRGIILNYLKSRWKSILEQANIPFNLANLKTFLKSRNLGNRMYQNYLSSN